MDRNLALEAVRVTEAAALAASRLMGCGDEEAADRAAIKAMWAALNSLGIDGTVIIGAGEDSGKLSPGDKVGAAIGSGPRIDVALDPLEGVTICAKGGPNALSVIALSQRGGFLKTPDVYMDKIAVGPGLPADLVDLDASPAENLRALARARAIAVSDLVVCILDRPRHTELIAKVRETGARITLIDDGDVSGAIATCIPQTGVDLYLGSGGAPEGVLAAAAVRCIGGQMQGRLLFRDEAERAKARQADITDLTRKYSLTDLAGGPIMFAATGITDGAMLRGVRRRNGSGAITHSLVMRSQSGTIRYIEAHHDTGRKVGLCAADTPADGD